MHGSSGLFRIGLIVFLLGLVVLFPARVAYRWFAPPAVQFGGIGGSIWSGRAEEATAGGMYFRELQWRFRPWSLLSGKLGYAIETEPSASYVQGDIALGFGDTVVAKNLTATFPLSSLQTMLGTGDIDGRLTANFAALRIEAGVPVVARGTAAVAGLRIPQVADTSIGRFEAEFFSRDSGITASIEDANAVLDLAGSLQLSPDGNYVLLAQVTATGQTPASLRQQLEYLGPANERGQRELRLEGRL